MKRRTVVYLCLFAMVSTVPGVSASALPGALSSGAAGPEKAVLTLDEAVRSALQRDPLLKNSRLAGQSAAAELAWAKSQRLPRAKASAGSKFYGNLKPFAVDIPGLGAEEIAPAIPDRYSLGLQVNQPVYTGEKIKTSIQIASLQRERADSDSAAREADVVLAAVQAYWDLVTARSSAKTIRESIERENAHLEDARNRLEAGLATRNDVLAAEVRLEKVRLMLLEAENTARLAAANLKYVAQIDPEGRELEEPGQQSGAAAAEAADLVATAVRNRPEVAALRKSVEASGLAVSLERSALLPQVSLTGGVDYARPNQLILPPEEKWSPTYVLSVSVDWTVWDNHATDRKMAEARLAKEQAENSLRHLLDTIEVEVTQARLNWVNATASLETAKVGVDKARESLKVANDLYRGGLGKASDVIDAEASLLEAELSVVEARVDIEVARAKLLRATGELPWVQTSSKSPS